jgi:hypothetical protein
MILSCELQKMGQTPRSWWNCAKGICHVKTWIFFCRPTVLASSWGFSSGYHYGYHRGLSIRFIGHPLDGY